MRQATARQAISWLPGPPLDFSQPYSLGNYRYCDISGQIARKYLDRRANLRRAWTRICTHFPETLDAGQRFDILEFSTAHGAMLEIWRAMGHNVAGTDYCVPEEFRKTYKAVKPSDEVFGRVHGNPVGPPRTGWVYQPIIESLGIDVDLFDAGRTPYAYAENSFDFICCYQALEAYARPADWGRILSEFCRIARKGVVIGFNPPPLRSDKNEGWNATQEAWEKLRTYDENGFRCVFFEFGETRRGFHPTACKLTSKTG